MKTTYHILPCFARYPLVLLLLFLFTGQVLLADQIDIGIFESSAPNKMEIRMRPDFTINSDGFISGILFTVRWSNPNLAITAVDYIYPYNVGKIGITEFEGGYYYQRFGATPGDYVGTVIPAGTEKVISLFSYAGSGDICFEIINNEWTQAHNGNFYIEFWGSDYTGIIYEPTAPEGCFVGPCTLELTCPANISVPPDAGSCGAVVTYSAPIVGGDCPDAVVTQTAGLPSGSLFPAGLTTNTFMATSSQAEEPVSCSFTVTVNSLPGAAGSITGTTPVCQGQNGVSYSVAPITNATSYVWTYTGTDATIIGNSNTVTVDYGATATSGNLKVYGTNACGNGTVSPNYQITVN
ncbi:MAG: HYR domain-containing protein, partial [Bacteroidales bacterium]|nr:HYR domain-containing protein [Bacteroidales bacterium]